MKTIGMLGGMSWESTASYYKVINEGVRDTLGGLHSARICMYSVDFEKIEKLQYQGDWKETAVILARGAKAIEAGGADFLLICTNTMHKVASEIEAAISIPLLHIADATGVELRKNTVKRVGLLGTRFTMQENFYKGRLTEKYGIEVIVPELVEQDSIHSVIYKELCLGKIRARSLQKFLDIIHSLRDKGAEAVILACTEIALLVQQKHTSVPLYDTTRIHAMAAVKKAIETKITVFPYL